MSDVEALDNVTKAFALARLGIKVFPVNAKTRQPFPGTRGFYDATSDDAGLIATWFTLDHEEASTVVGVWTGGSNLVVVDIDRKNGKNGFTSIKASGRTVNETERYRTKNGGEHRIWQTDRIDLVPGQKSLGMEGVDIRAGGSYIVWWGDKVPKSRDAFSADIPDWVIEASAPSAASFEGEGFSGGVTEWLGAIPDDTLPSGRVREFLARIPTEQFGHKEMTDLAWGAVRLGSERETGIRMALDALRTAWLRAPYDTPKYRRDLDAAIRGAINKAGRVQKPLPTMLSVNAAMAQANKSGVKDALVRLNTMVSETDGEVGFAKSRREMFRVAAEAGLSPGAALGVVISSKAFEKSKASLESVWFGDGENQYQGKADREAEDEEAAQVAHDQDSKDELEKLIQSMAEDAEGFSFLTEAEVTAAAAHDWWGKDYLKWVESRLKHFNKPYHVGTMWAVLSTIASPWGKVPLPGAKPTDCNLYVNILGDSTSGKSESWGFGTAMIDAYHGVDLGPIIGDIGKLSALALHRTLILRDGKASLVYGDEVQSFFQGVQYSQWQSGILGDISSHYGGDVSPKLTLNDKEVSGKRAKTMLTVYLTGIADQTLEAINIKHWTNGFFYRFLWGFGFPRKGGDFDVVFESSTASYSAQLDTWAREFKRVGALQEMKWGAGRIVQWDEDARKRISKFTEQIDEAVRKDAMYDNVFVAANKRFAVSIMKCATLIALSETASTVSLDHVLVALSFAGPWHRSMVLAVSETAKEPFDREVERCLNWIKRNAIRQLGKQPWVQRTAVMRQFRPNESADRLLRQLTEEGWLIRAGDTYQISES